VLHPSIISSFSYLASGLPYRSLDRATRDRLSTALEALAIHAGERTNAITVLATPQAQAA
jgi:hypothetical protein